MTKSNGKTYRKVSKEIVELASKLFSLVKESNCIGVVVIEPQPDFTDDTAGVQSYGWINTNPTSKYGLVLEVAKKMEKRFKRQSARLADGQKKRQMAKLEREWKKAAKAATAA